MDKKKAGNSERTAGGRQVDKAYRAEGRLHGRTTAYILRLLLDQSKPLLLYEFSQVAAYADNPFMGRQYQPVPMQYAGWFRHEIRSIYEQLRAAGVPVREMITERQRVISW